MHAMFAFIFYYLEPSFMMLISRFVLLLVLAILSPLAAAPVKGTLVEEVIRRCVGTHRTFTCRVRCVFAMVLYLLRLSTLSISVDLTSVRFPLQVYHIDEDIEPRALWCFSSVADVVMKSSLILH